MKILLYFEGESVISKSGIGRAFKHQQRALESAGIEFTTDPWCPDYDILHINTYYMNSEAIVKNAREHGKKVIYHAHSTEEDFRNSFTLSNTISPAVKKWLMHLYTQADALMLSSHELVKKHHESQDVPLLSANERNEYSQSFDSYLMRYDPGHRNLKNLQYPTPIYPHTL